MDDDGQLVMRGDVYGLDSRMISAIRSERGIVEAVTAKDRDRDTGPVSSGPSPRRQQVRLQPQPSGPQSFFQALFGGGQPSSMPNSQGPRPPARVIR